MTAGLFTDHIVDPMGAVVLRVPEELRQPGDCAALQLFTSSCTTFECACLEMDIVVTESDGPRRAKLRLEPERRHLELVSDDDGLLSAGIWPFVVERVCGEHAAFFEARARRTKTRNLERPWRLRSWVGYEPGELIPFHEAVPGEPDLVATVGGVRYWARDLYCVSKQCDCHDATLDLLPSAGESGHDPAAGFVRVELHSGDVTSSDHPALREVYSTVRATYGIDELRSRYQRMREMARDPQLRLAPHSAAPPAKSTKVGRNDPCVCGSGKKSKKCCGRA